MGILKDKILSYSPEQYYVLDSTYTGTTLSNSGSGGTAVWTKTGSDPVLNSTGGPDGTGAWQFSTNSSSETSLVITNTGGTGTNAVLNPEVTDADYSSGAWFRIPVTISGSTETVIQLLRIGGEAAVSTVSFNLTSTLIGKLTINNPTSLTTTNRVDDGMWHYYAERLYFDGTNLIKERYLDGTLLHSGITSDTNSLNYISLGDNFVTNSTGNLNYIEFAHTYITPASSIDATAIAQIWATGNAINITITETPATASATQTEPTIAVTAGDHTEITTSIVVDATFPSSISVLGQSNIEIHPDTVPTATIEMINNIDISTGINVSWSALEMIGSAELVEPLLPLAAMTASATSGNHTVYVTPNYYSLVRQSNPYIYYYDGLASTSKNGGYQSGTFAIGPQTTASSDAGVPLNFIGNGKSWGLSSASNADNYLDFTSPSVETSFAQHILNGECSVELWYKPSIYPEYGTFPTYENTWTLFETEGLEISTVTGRYVGERGALRIIYKQGNTVLSTHTSAYGYITTNNTHHIVVTITAATTNNIQITGWVDGVAVISLTREKTSWTVADTSIRFGSALGYNNNKGMGPGWFDEVALYSNKLSNSEIITHYSFINESSPNRNISVDAITVNAESGNHNFIVVSNIYYSATVIESSANVVNPSTIASRVIDISATAITASAESKDVTVYWGWTINAATAVSYAEAVNAYRLNDIYYNYVQANIVPYRYVTFDGNNSYLDYGTDNYYAVAPVVVGGTIVNPDEGINGKSAKTTGTSYVTDGVILKESEYNDNWGTGLNNYHSSFWMQKSDDDASTTGLRVLWNLNGYADNQHVILYQYQGKLHMQFNNGSGTHITQSTTSSYDLFDGQRHFVGIAFDHTGSNNRVNLFIDAVDVMTVNLGSYTGTTINGTTPVGANDEANNHPRLSVGSLITPFAATALPVIPTNTRIYVDEVIWAKSSLTQTLATNLFNIMPIKGEVKVYATPITASDEFVMPLISSSSNISVDYSMALSEIIQPTTYIERESINNVAILDSSAELIMPAIFENRTIIADIFVANAIFNDAGIAITIPGGPMIASADIIKRKIIVNYNTIYPRTQYTQMLVDSSFAGIQIFPMKEIS